MRRPSEVPDNASPCGSSSLAGALLTASALAGADRAASYRDAAENALSRAGLLAARAPRFAGWWLAVAEARERGPLQVAIVGAAGDARRQELARAALSALPGGALLVIGEPDEVPLLAERSLVDGGPAAYVCRGYVCERPVTSVDEVVAALS